MSGGIQLFPHNVDCLLRIQSQELQAIFLHTGICVCGLAVVARVRMLRGEEGGQGSAASCWLCGSFLILRHGFQECQKRV